MAIYQESGAEEKQEPFFSVAMCVYGGDRAEWFDAALSSVIRQTVLPSEIVLVVDGPVPQAMEDVISRCEAACAKRIAFRVIRLAENVGHGIARRTALAACRHAIVALMDADDVCLPGRFQEELPYFADERIDLVGSDIAEFIGQPENIVAYRRVPTTDEEIRRDMKKRCPFNQMTVMFRKSRYEEAGGYLDWHCEEDYYLWLRMMQKGAGFANTGTVLVSVRVGEEMYRRRGGWKYFKSEARLQRYMLKNDIIGPSVFLVNCAKRLIVQVLMPNKLRGFVFQKFARKGS